MTRPSDDPPAAIPASHQLGDPHRQTPACNDRPTTLAQVDSDIFLGRLRATWAYETPRDYHGTAWRGGVRISTRHGYARLLARRGGCEHRRMTRAAPSASTTDRDLPGLLELLRGVDSVELKLTVPESDQRSAVSALEMDPIDAQIRQVFFSDTPHLTPDRHGVVVRARRATPALFTRTSRRHLGDRGAGARLPDPLRAADATATSSRDNGGHGHARGARGRDGDGSRRKPG